MEEELARLKVRYKLKGLKIRRNPKMLRKRKVEAAFNYLLFEIALKDYRICKERLLSLLHEICHAIQLKEGRLVANKKSTRQMYWLEFEAEMFAIEQYEKFYAKKYGSCLKDLWTLGDYQMYRQYFKSGKKG